MSDIKVSILCAAYNQERYIGKMLSSLVNQKTNFKFEILINDDASIDSTPAIIESFHKRYPEIVKPIYQKNNKYSKGVSISKDILIPLASGKYFAFCEGDDFWIDDKKIQKQFDYMESHPDCSLCINNSINVKESGEFHSNHQIIEKSGIISFESVVKGRGAFCATNSIFARVNAVRKLPDYFNILIIDQVWQLYLASLGSTYCFSDYMSAYRVNSIGSWTVNVKKDYRIKMNVLEKMVLVLKRFNSITGYKNNQCILNEIYNCQLQLNSIYRHHEESFYRNILLLMKRLVIICLKKINLWS